MPEKKFFLFIIAIMLTTTLYAGCALTYDTWKIPKPAQYDLSEQATCMAITDYMYDETGRLSKTTEYCYVGYLESVDDTGERKLYYYNDASKWYQKNETIFFYDSQSRLAKTEQYVSNVSAHEPYYVVEYRYDEDGGYSETGSIRGDFDYEKTYDGSGKLISDITTSREDSFYYYYNEKGDLTKVTYRDSSDYEITVASLIYDDTGSVSVQSYRSGSYYALWLDQYDENKNRVSSYWYLAYFRNPATEYSFKEIESISVPSYQAHYDDGRLVDAITANEWVRTLKANKTYTVQEYEFFDYDEYGQMIWHYQMGTSDTTLYASHYIYDEDKLVQEVYYRIERDWQHTLYDCSVIEIHRDDSGKPIDITRYGSSGNILYCYLFQDGSWGTKHLAYTLNDAGDVVLDWKTAGKTLAELGAQDDNDINDHENSGEPPDTDWIVYIVKKGDCLWDIAEKLLNDGKRWPEIYDNNRAVIGDNPSLIYEGTELNIFLFCAGCVDESEISEDKMPTASQNE